MTTSTTHLSSDTLAPVVAQTIGRLHTAREGTRCRCGACRHQILVASRHSGVALGRIVAALPPEFASDLTSEFHPTPAKRPRNPFVVMDAVTVTNNGHQTQGADAILTLLGAA
ncbi:hypothetical protein [Nocardioides sp.]|uniref:hypothetical protein n=1 Tax=Nocardioides sp. TaxID=35761 RepID=UPI003D116D86